MEWYAYYSGPTRLAPRSLGWRAEAESHTPEAVSHAGEQAQKSAPMVGMAARHGGADVGGAGEPEAVGARAAGEPGGLAAGLRVSASSPLDSYRGTLAR